MVEFKMEKVQEMVRNGLSRAEIREYLRDVQMKNIFLDRYEPITDVIIEDILDCAFKKRDDITKAFWSAIASRKKIGFYEQTINDLLFKVGYDGDGRQSGLEELLKQLLLVV